jgi:SAM-dependent methyltransferase
LARLEAWLARNSVVAGPEAVCAEYGCGVGRATHCLARRFRRVIAFDISEPHIRAAKDWLAKSGIDNVEFVHVRDRESLARLKDFDIFYSEIVLQHNPPPIALDILRSAFSAVPSGGVCFFQIPTYSTDYRFTLEIFWRDVAVRKQMEMHFVPQPAIFDLAHASGLVPLEVQPDLLTGDRWNWISNTFLLKRPAQST